MHGDGARVGHSLGRGRQIVGGGLLAAVSTALLLGCFELGFRLAGYEALYEVYSKPSIFWQHDDLLGWSHVPGAEGVYVGPRPWPVEYRAPVRINSIGLRGPEVPELPEGGFRILMLGDSLVAGFEVAYEATFVAQLEAKLNAALEFPVQTISAGVRGYGTDQQYLWFAERGRRLEPHLVVAFLSLNDADDNVTLHRMRRPFGKSAFSVDAAGNLERRGHPIPRYPICAEVRLDESFAPVRTDRPLRRTLCAIETGLSNHSAFFTWVTQRIRRNPALLRRLYDLASLGAAASLDAVLGAAPAAAEPVDASPTPAWALTTRLLRELARSVRASGAEFRVVVARAQWEAMDVASLEREGIEPIFGALSLADELGRYLHFQNDAHLNETGHEMMARLLADRLAPVVRAARLAPQPEPGEDPAAASHGR